MRLETDEEGHVLEVGDYAVRVPVPRTKGQWLGFALRRVKGKLIGLALSAALLTLFSFVNCMDLLLGVEATPSFLKRFAKGEADRVRVVRKRVVRFGPELRDLARDRSLMVLEVTSEVKLRRKLDLKCDLVGPSGFADGWVRKSIAPSELAGGIPAGVPVTVELDFPQQYRPHGECQVIEAR